MLLYDLFWMFIGFIKHFYIIFGTNLLTQSPVPVSVFFLVFEYQRKGIPNGVQLTCQILMIFYGPKEDPGVKELGQKSPGLSMRVGGTPTPPGAPAYLVDDSGTFLT